MTKLDQDDRLALREALIQHIDSALVTDRNAQLLAADAVDLLERLATRGGDGRSVVEGLIVHLFDRLDSTRENWPGPWPVSARAIELGAAAHPRAKELAAWVDRFAEEAHNPARHHQLRAAAEALRELGDRRVGGGA